MSSTFQLSPLFDGKFNAFELGDELEKLKKHLIDELDYALLPTEAWEKLVEWYGVKDGQSAIARQVVEHGMFVKHCKVEVYLVELKLCRNRDMEACQIRPFSRADNIGWYELSIELLLGFLDVFIYTLLLRFVYLRQSQRIRNEACY